MSVNDGCGDIDLIQRQNDPAGNGVSMKPPVTLTDLPPELHLAISQRLTYPDALSLKHTSRAFFYLVDTGVKLKVAWLVERHTLHLECPNDRCCDLRSDLQFCKGSVRWVYSVHRLLAAFANQDPSPRGLADMLSQASHAAASRTCRVRVAPGLGLPCIRDRFVYPPEKAAAALYVVVAHPFHRRALVDLVVADTRTIGNVLDGEDSKLNPGIPIY